MSHEAWPPGTGPPSGLARTARIPGVPETDRPVLEALGDAVAVSILAALSLGERDAHALVLETRLPQSSIYRKLRDLEAEGVVYVGRLAFTPEGRKVELFSSRIRGVSVDFLGGSARVVVHRREDSADRIRDLWSQVRGR